MTDTPHFEGDLSWAHRGACTDHPHPEWWFPGDEYHAAGYDLARKICSRCPVLEQCQAHGIEHELHGMWGGLTAKQRQSVRRGNPIPPLVPVAESRVGPARGRRAALTPEQAEKVRQADGNYRMIAEQFGISRSTVVNIKSGQGVYAPQGDPA